MAIPPKMKEGSATLTIGVIFAIKFSSLFSVSLSCVAAGVSLSFVFQKCRADWHAFRCTARDVLDGEKPSQLDAIARRTAVAATLLLGVMIGV